jgi:hypothetical protein
MITALQRLSRFFSDYAATIYSMPPEEDRRPRRVVTQIRTTRRATEDMDSEEGVDEMVLLDDDDDDEDCDTCSRSEENEDGLEEDEKWVFLEDVRITLSYDAFSDYWVLGYYPISDIGVEVIARDPEVAISEFIDCMTRQWHFIAGDVDECVSDLDKELKLFTRSVADRKEVLGWD